LTPRRSAVMRSHGHDQIPPESIGLLAILNAL
jgi:hypothetical protein